MSVRLTIEIADETWDHLAALGKVSGLLASEVAAALVQEAVQPRVRRVRRARPETDLKLTPADSTVEAR